MLPPIPCLFAEAPAASPSLDTTRVAVSADANVQPESSTYSSSASTASGAIAGGSADVTLYPWRPLVDDESPRSLQPFLQRTSDVAIDVGGTYLWTSYSVAAGGGTYSQDDVHGSASVRWFVLPALAILASAGGTYLHDDRLPAASASTTRNTAEPWGQVGVDVRSGDASLSLQWQAVTAEQTVNGRSNPALAFFGARFTLAGRVVIDRRFDLTAGAMLVPDGAEGNAGLGWYPTKDLGLSLSGHVEHGQIYWNTTTVYDSIFGGPSISYWVGRRVALSLSYAPRWVSWSGGTEWQHDVTLGITGRIPGE